MDEENLQAKNLLKEYIELYNADISKVFEYFKTEEIQKIINEQPQEIKKYLKQHFIKTHNLVMAIYSLLCCNNIKPLYDEANIIFRSLFEHTINFLYIFTHSNSDEQIYLINRFYDYIPIACNKYFWNFNQENNQDIKNTEEYQVIQEVCNESKSIEKTIDIINKYKNTYNTTNIKSWTGITMPRMLNYIFTTPIGKPFILYRKFYADANPYVHCNILAYMNDDGVIVDNTDISDGLKIIHKTSLMLIGYIELFFYLIGLNIKEIYPQMFDNYDKLSKKYREYIANNPPKTIGY